MINFKNLIYTLACTAYIAIVGSALYEHLVIWPVAFSAPPSSLTMFQGQYVIDGGKYWALIHPIILIFAILNLIVHWKTERRKNILVFLGGYILILAVTFSYFLPELISITGTEYSNTVDDALTGRAKLWLLLSWVRFVFIILFAVIYLMGLTKKENKYV